jgi:hypothetical protein
MSISAKKEGESTVSLTGLETLIQQNIDAGLAREEARKASEQRAVKDCQYLEESPIPAIFEEVAKNLAKLGLIKDNNNIYLCVTDVKEGKPFDKPTLRLMWDVEWGDSIYHRGSNSLSYPVRWRNISCWLGKNDENEIKSFNFFAHTNTWAPGLRVPVADQHLAEDVDKHLTQNFPYIGTHCSEEVWGNHSFIPGLRIIKKISIPKQG